ncbi:MAG: hypothetical protein ABI866_03950, partial [Dokdonella sp.]
MKVNSARHARHGALHSLLVGALKACLALVCLWSVGACAAYVSETRTIVSSGVSRSFVLARPASIPVGSALPLVFSLHGDGGSGAAMRGGLPLEAQATTGAVFIYPNAPGGTFEYYTYDGR